MSRLNFTDLSVRLCAAVPSSSNRETRRITSWINVSYILNTDKAASSNYLHPNKWQVVCSTRYMGFEAHSVSCRKVLTFEILFYQFQSQLTLYTFCWNMQIDFVVNITKLSPHLKFNQPPGLCKCLKTFHEISKDFIITVNKECFILQTYKKKHKKNHWILPCHIFCHS